MLCMEEGDPYGQHISKSQTIWQLSGGGEKSIPALKTNIVLDMVD